MRWVGLGVRGKDVFVHDATATHRCSVVLRTSSGSSSRPLPCGPSTIAADRTIVISPSRMRVSQRLGGAAAARPKWRCHRHRMALARRCRSRKYRFQSRGTPWCCSAAAATPRKGCGSLPVALASAARRRARSVTRSQSRRAINCWTQNQRPTATTRTVTQPQVPRRSWRPQEAHSPRGAPPQSASASVRNGLSPKRLTLHYIPIRPFGQTADGDTPNRFPREKRRNH